MAVCTYMYNFGGVGMGIPVSLSVGIDDMLDNVGEIHIGAGCVYLYV